jgi:hypothetical protein
MVTLATDLVQQFSHSGNSREPVSTEYILKIFFNNLFTLNNFKKAKFLFWALVSRGKPMTHTHAQVQKQSLPLLKPLQAKFGVGEGKGRE